MLKRLRNGIGLALLLGAPVGVNAHGFGRLYNLPVPFWLYAWAAAAALLISFMLAVYFATASATAPQGSSRDISRARWVRMLAKLLPVLKLISVLLLLLCIVTGWFGSRDPFRNFSMTFFWVVFLLLFTYVTALVGNLYAALNPWRVLAEMLGRVWRGYTKGRMVYPQRLGDWPALALYLLFIWFELFGFARPQQLASLLLAYSLINLLGVWLVGISAWFQHAEFFSVFLRLLALISPLGYHRAESPSQRSALYWRRPFSALVQEQPVHLSTVVFVLAMLSTTTFDGLRATQWWVRLFWSDPTGIVTALAGSRPVNAYASLRPWYISWETFWLVISPFLYFAAYFACVWLAKCLARSRQSTRQMALQFGYTLLPMALVYHLTHYATLILTQGPKILSLSSDPFGWGWDLFGTAMHFRAPYLPGMGLVWHSQVGLILFGHIVSVYLAHVVALGTLQTRRQAWLSQLPMLGLMMLFTVVGLWILAQPLTVELLR